MNAPFYHIHSVEAHLRLLCDSYLRITGQLLINQDESSDSFLDSILTASFALVSHGTESDPVFNFGNNCALKLFEMTLEDFTRLPSRKSAEAPNRQDRARLLAEVTQNGFISNYTGIRISSSGKRFQIRHAVVWNVIDENGLYCGQAAKFEDWKFLPACCV